MDNTITTPEGVQIYTHLIYQLADEYVEKQLKGDADKVPDYWIDMIYYIADRIEKPSNDDIELLDAIFDIFVRLCSRYKVLPTLEVFGFLVRINANTFSSWSNGDYRLSSSHGITVKKWKDTCKSFVVNRLSNQNSTNVNLIFIAKSAYGMTETVPVPAINEHQMPVLTASQLPKLGGELLPNVDD